MKKVSIFGLSFLTVIAFATITFFNSCEDDPCKDVVCINGTCVSGSCDCELGYEGTDCGIESRDKFTDSWTVSDGCSQSGTSSYAVTIINGSTVNEVKITNFWDVFTNQVIAIVDGNTISIASQEPDNDGFIVSGQGTISGTTITWSYTIDDTLYGTGTDVCTSSWTN